MGHAGRPMGRPIDALAVWLFEVVPVDGPLIALARRTGQLGGTT